MNMFYNFVIIVRLLAIFFFSKSILEAFLVSYYILKIFIPLFLLLIYPSCPINFHL